MTNSWKISELELIPELENLLFESGNTVIAATGYGNDQHTPEFLPVQDTYPSGITRYVKISLGHGLPSETGIFIPAGFSPSEPADLLIYLHGHKLHYPKGAPIHEYWNGKKYPAFSLREEVTRSGRKNIILVAPTLGNHSESGSLVRKGGFDNFINMVIASVNAMLAENHVYGFHTGRIILSAHSGSGITMLRIAHLPDYHVAEIAEYWGFDCIYGSVEPDWINWAQRNPGKRLFIYFLGTKTRSCEILKLSEARNVKNICVQRSSAKADTHTGAHDWVPRTQLPERLSNRPCINSGCAKNMEEEIHTIDDKISWEQVRQNAVTLANREYEKWDRGHRHETNPAFRDTLVKYYRDGAGFTMDQAQHLADRIQYVRQTGTHTFVRDPKPPMWSAVFISWIMKTAGAGKYFKYSSGHYVYVAAAKRNRINNAIDNPFWAYRINEQKPQPGDIVCNARCKDDQHLCATYDNVDNGTEWPMHCDIVVEVLPGEIHTIGGNTVDQFGGLKASTVGKKKIALDENGFIKPGNNHIAIIKFRTGSSSVPAAPRASVIPAVSMIPSGLPPTQSYPASIRNLSSGEIRHFLRYVKPYISIIENQATGFPLEFILGWIQVESGGNNSTVMHNSLDERGFFQISRAESASIGADHERIDKDAAYSIGEGIRLINYYSGIVSKAGFNPADEVFLKLVKFCHAAGTGSFGGVVRRIKHSGVHITTWAAFKSFLFDPSNRIGEINHLLKNPKRFTDNVDEVFKWGAQLVSAL